MASERLLGSLSLNRDYNNPKREKEEQQDVLVLEEDEFENKLVVWNDDVNTFDFVIDCLVSICKHSLIQAEQCTLLIHYKGKCTVKSGSLEVLKLMHEKLLDKGLTSEIV